MATLEALVMDLIPPIRKGYRKPSSFGGNMKLNTAGFDKLRLRIPDWRAPLAESYWNIGKARREVCQRDQKRIPRHDHRSKRVDA